MNDEKQNLNNLILANWKAFPWKLDYIFHLLFSNDNSISDIQFDRINGEYVVQKIKISKTKVTDHSPSTFEKPNNNLFDKFTIPEKELLHYLNANNSFNFLYKTKIFHTEYTLNCTRSLIIKDSILFFNFSGHPNGVNFNQFNLEFEKYVLLQDLNKNLSTTSNIEKKMKI